MGRYSKPLLLFAALALLPGQPKPDTIQLQNTAGCHDHGLLIWGKIQGAPALPVIQKAGCSSTASVGPVDPAPGGPNQLVSFTVGRPPAINSDVDWAAAAPIKLAYPNLFEIPLKIWVLYTPSNCDFACQKQSLEEFLIWANELLLDQRAGLQLKPVSAANWISDATSNQSPAVTRYRTFTITQPDDCDIPPLQALQNELKQVGALNLYVTYKVEGSTKRGYMCTDATDLVFAASKASWGTILHEIGHTFDLSHTDLLKGFDTENLMHSASDDRAYLTEGQVFRAHFSKESTLNTVFTFRVTDARSCVGSSVEPGRPCPPVETAIWREK